MLCSTISVTERKEFWVSYIYLTAQAELTPDVYDDRSDDACS